MEIMKTYIVDCEASSLQRGSYPIEIAWVDVATGQGESYLIRPEPQWTDWNMASEAIHHIDRDLLLREGRSAVTVAKRAMTVLSGARLISDNPQADGHWLTVLAQAGGITDIPAVQHINSVYAEQIRRMTATVTAPETGPGYWNDVRLALDRGQIVASNVIEAENAKGRHSHRALADAQNMWLTVRAVVEAIDREIALTSANRCG